MPHLFKNLPLEQRLFTIATIAVCLPIIAVVAITFLASQAMPIYWMVLVGSIALGSSIAVLALFKQALKQETSHLDEIQQILLEMGNGQFERRIVNIKTGTLVSEIAWLLNDALDQLEAFLRETKTAQQSSIRGEYHRKALPLGMRGGYKVGLEELNESLMQVQEGAEAVASQQSQLSDNVRLVTEFLETVKDKNTQIAATIAKNSKNTTQVADLSAKTVERAHGGVSAVHKTVEGMNTIAEGVDYTVNVIRDLNTNSERIGTIAQTIQEIADQTDLLALNAAIESARAGEAGKGFAVVADEIRKLAERTQSSTKEITDTIRDIQEQTEVAVQASASGTQKVNDGISLAKNAGSVLQTIVESITTVNDIMQQIAIASEEQATTSSDISTHINSFSLNGNGNGSLNGNHTMVALSPVSDN